MTDRAESVQLQILGVTEGPFVRALLKSARDTGVRFDRDWKDLSRFVKFVNDGWRKDPGAGSGWFPPRIFDGVPRLHLPRTLTVLAMAAYYVEARGLVPECIRDERRPVVSAWFGELGLSGSPVCIQEPGRPPLALLEVVYLHVPGPVSEGGQRALMESYGLQPFREETGMVLLYGFARAAGDVQGFSLPLLEAGGQLLPANLEELPPASVTGRFFQEPLNPTRVARHLERYRELFDMPESLDRAWNRAGLELLRRLLGPKVILA